MKDIDPDKPFAGGLDSIFQNNKQPAPASFDYGSPFGSKTVEEMEEENRKMQQFRFECLERSTICRFLNMSSDYWKQNEKQN